MALKDVLEKVETMRNEIFCKTSLDVNYTDDNVSDLYISVTQDGNVDDSWYMGELIGQLEALNDVLDILIEEQRITS